MNIQIKLIGIILLLGSCAYGQNEVDAYRHGQSTLVGSARMLGMGGAFSAAGGDIGVATTNPAGLGVLRSSVFTLTPTYSFGNIDGQFINQNQRGNSSYFGIPNWGAAFTTVNYYDEESRRKSGKNLKSYTLAFGHNQTENYHINGQVGSAFNEFSSITNSFAEQAQGVYFGDLFGDGTTPGLAHET